MTEVTEKKVAKKARKPRPRPSNAVQFTVWPANGSQMTEEVVAAFEAAIQNTQVELFNKGYRLLTQTTKG